MPCHGSTHGAVGTRRFCAFSPEFFYTWHQVPNGTAYADDVSSVYGLRLNLTWYLH